MTEGPAGRVVVLDIVGLATDHLAGGLAPTVTDVLAPDATAGLDAPFPAVTVPVQTTLGEGRGPASHGDVSNGEYDRERDSVAFWERDVGSRRRLWEAASDVGITTGVLFFQHIKGTTADVAVTPSPIEDEDNNLLEMNCWTNPDGFYDDLREEYGHFPLHNYWGPAANLESSRWILNAANEAVERYDLDLLWVYLPHLDYAGQQAGPGSAALREAVGEVDELVGEFFSNLQADDRWEETVVTVVGEYGFNTVDAPVFPNRRLREAGLLAVTDDGEGGEEVDLVSSRAFAMVDHQVAHVYVDGDETAARELLESLDGVDDVLVGDEKTAAGVDHPNAGDLVLVAEPSAWFQYYWWTDDRNAPHYATDMDIHAKPGYDPCELFFGETGLASLDPTKVRGSHGRFDSETTPVCGFGGPAVPDGMTLPGPVDARSVAPTVADLLGVTDAVEMQFEVSSLLDGDRPITE